jgi:hypothetical protein
VCVEVFVTLQKMCPHVTTWELQMAWASGKEEHLDVWRCPIPAQVGEVEMESDEEQRDYGMDGDWRRMSMTSEFTRSFQRFSDLPFACRHFLG